MFILTHPVNFHCGRKPDSFHIHYQETLLWPVASTHTPLSKLLKKLCGRSLDIHSIYLNRKSMYVPVLIEYGEIFHTWT